MYILYMYICTDSNDITGPPYSKWTPSENETQEAIYPIAITGEELHCPTTLINTNKEREGELQL